jgi:hypothetical protein
MAELKISNKMFSQEVNEYIYAIFPLQVFAIKKKTDMEFQNNLWGLGTE